jgi:hypothetical protein
MKIFNIICLVFLGFCTTAFGQFKTKNLTTFTASPANASHRFWGNNLLPRDSVGFDEYGGKVSAGIFILGGIGIPVRFYINPKNVFEVNVSSATVLIVDDARDLIEFSPVFGTGVGYTFFGNRFLKEKKSVNKVRAHGVALRLNRFWGVYDNTQPSISWAMETFRQHRPKRSFLFELGLRSIIFDQTNAVITEQVSAGLFLRCQWNFFLK